ncbi:MAG: hypothetical protein ABI969_13660 [bacterium]
MSTPELWADPRGAYAVLALLALALIGATMAPGGLRSRRRGSRRIIATAVLIGVALSLLWPQYTRRRALEEQPPVPNLSQLAGTWRDGTDTLELRSDGLYRCRGTACTGFGAHGTWTHDATGALVARWGDGHTVAWRIVRYNGRYRLGLLPARDAGATWEPRLVFERVGP